VAVGAVVAREDVPTASSKPRYALSAEFAALFNPELDGLILEKAIAVWQDRESGGFKKTVSLLAWSSFAWFVSEPENVFVLHDGAVSLSRLSELIGAAANGA
jgi:hypothetical protein